MRFLRQCIIVHVCRAKNFLETGFIFQSTALHVYMGVGIHTSFPCVYMYTRDIQTRPFSVISGFPSICSKFSAPYLLQAEEQTRLAWLNFVRTTNGLWLTALFNVLIFVGFLHDEGGACSSLSTHHFSVIPSSWMGSFELNLQAHPV